MLCAAGYNMLRMIVSKGVAFLQSAFLCRHQASSGWRPWLASVVPMLIGRQSRGYQPDCSRTSIAGQEMKFRSALEMNISGPTR